MGDDDRGESLGAQGRALDIRFMSERRGDDDRGGDATCLQPDRVVQTARRAGPSIAYRGDDDVVLGGNPVEQIGRRHPREAVLRVAGDR